MPRKPHYTVLFRCCKADQKIADAEIIDMEYHSQLIAQRKMRNLFDRYVWDVLVKSGHTEDVDLFVQTDDYVWLSNDFAKIEMKVVPTESLTDGVLQM